MQLLQGDCLKLFKSIPDNSIDLVLTDPPYNIGKASWDNIENYIDWSMGWIKECQRVLKPNGVFYFWHNDITQIAELLHEIKQQTNLEFRSFCIWDKGDTYRAQSWKNRVPGGRTALRQWFNICEYCLHFFNVPDGSQYTGLERVNSNPECYKSIKDWYNSELDRLHLDNRKIGARYTEVTGKQPYMLRHYFQDSQFEIPTGKVWEGVYMPLGFNKDYEELRKDYEELRKDYERLRNTHNVDPMHCNVWHVPNKPHNAKDRFHPCDKPVQILERLIRVSSRDGATVLDCFMGGGSTGVACVNTGRRFIGIEQDEGYYKIAQERIRSTDEHKVTSSAT